MFLPRRFYIIILALVAILAAGYWWHWLVIVGQVLLALFAFAVMADIVLLWHKRGIVATRQCSDRFSCGDDNEVALHIDSNYPFDVDLHVIDEVPHIFNVVTLTSSTIWLSMATAASPITCVPPSAAFMDSVEFGCLLPPPSDSFSADLPATVPLMLRCILATSCSIATNCWR